MRLPSGLGVIDSRIVRAEILEVDPPKHFYLTLRLPDGSKRQVWGGKHCGAADKAEVNGYINVRVNQYELENWIATQGGNGTFFGKHVL